MNAALGRTLIPAILAALLLPGVAVAQNYVGADKCKGCHEPAKMGKQHSTWKASPHAKAFATLATEESKKIAKEKGIADPQTDAKCLKCHDTAATAAADKLAKSFKKGQGVGCESCHGPAENHTKARAIAEDDAPIAEGEIVKKPGEKVCLECHNKESPTFKAFKFADAVKAIAHPKPGK